MYLVRRQVSTPDELIEDFEARDGNFGENLMRER